ncbi:hypothetical protein AB1Y20_019252 [Prymnesium parvum]|uniref:BioF2-like acetyltransferase domain-containing protein n=1 Tax=Prymnesium parvum TaxID=97485 RepID=A0AB34JR69_PRYPA
MPFASLSEEDQQAVRAAQKARKAARQQARKAKQPSSHAADSGTLPSAEGAAFPRSISREDYLNACAGGLFRHPRFPPTEDCLAVLLRMLNGTDEQELELGPSMSAWVAAHIIVPSQAILLNSCNYFQFSGSPAALWDPSFLARLAYEGFFTITASTGPRGEEMIEPLPELQPYYGVLFWKDFEQSKHVKQALSKLVRHPGKNAFCLVHNADPQRTWRMVDEYHEQRHGGNWLTERYFKAMERASENSAINFSMHCIELFEVTEQGVHGDEPLAGEIGFSVGKVYTSLSGFTAVRSRDGIGTAQLVLLGRWLNRKGFAFWSLGHCYSPEMDYKRQLGQRVYPRRAFLALLHQHRGPFHLSGDGLAEHGALRHAEVCDMGALLGDHDP